MKYQFRNTFIARILIATMILLGVQSASVNAAMVSTQTLIQQQHHSVNRQQLLDALESEQLQAQILSLGVDPNTAKQRINSLTAEEINQLNAQLKETPAGGDLAIVALTVFLIFVITDAMCATDLFTFVKCINKSP